jgi:glutaredoxin-like YruB-family protein
MTVGADAVTVFTTSTCPWCVRAKEFLKQKGVPYRERNIEFDPLAARELSQRTGQMGVPVITAGDEVIVGFDRPRLERLAARFAAPATEPTPDARPRPKIGLRVKDAPGGAEIGAVHPGSPAEHAGLRVGDVIVDMNARTVRSAADLEAVLASLTPSGEAGQTIAVDIRRNGRPQRVRLPI